MYLKKSTKIIKIFTINKPWAASWKINKIEQVQIILFLFFATILFSFYLHNDSLQEYKSMIQPSIFFCKIRIIRKKSLSPQGDVKLIHFHYAQRSSIISCELVSAKMVVQKWSYQTLFWERIFVSNLFCIFLSKKSRIEIIKNHTLYFEHKYVNSKRNSWSYNRSQTFIKSRVLKRSDNDLHSLIVVD